jgi:CBS domain-containing protein
MRACMSFALRSNGHVIHSDNNESFEGVNMAESIRDVMTSNPRSLESGRSAVEAARLMRDEEDGKLVGIVAQKDVAMHASEAQTGEVVEDISR